MEMLKYILLAIGKGDLLVSLTLQEAYLHISICPVYQKFLRFCYQDNPQ